VIIVTIIRCVVGLAMLVLGGLILRDLRLYFGVCAIAIGMGLLVKDWERDD